MTLEPARRMSIIRAFAVLSLSAWSLLYLVNLRDGVTAGALLYIIPVGCVLSLLATRSPRTQRFSGHLLILACVIGCHIIAAGRGGLISPTLGWYPVIVLSSMLILPAAEAAIWLAALVGSIAWFIGDVDVATWRSEVGRPVAYGAARAAACMVAFATTYVFERGRREAMARLTDKESELRRTLQELERSNHELEQFARAASHDLRGPLRAIAQVTKWLEEDLGPALVGEVESHVKLLRARASRMEALLTELLSFATAGRGDTKVEIVVLEELVEEVIQLSHIPAGFNVAVATPLPAVATMRLPLKRVLMNLVGNAVKHHDKPDGNVWLSAQSQGDSWEIIVADDGPGIPREFHEKAFEMFQTLKPKDEVEGSGMGLAMAKKLVEAAGGSIALRSEGRGCEFRVTLPSARVEP